MLVIYNCVSKCFTLKITVVQCVLQKLINVRWKEVFMDI